MPFIHIPKTLTIFFCFYALTLHGQPLTFQKQFGRPGADDANAVVELADGFLIAGQTTDPATNHFDAVLLRADKNGAVLWQKTYGGAENDVFNEVSPANDGGFIAWGSTRTDNQGNTDAWLVKTDDMGNLIWQRTIGTPAFFEGALGRIVPVPGGYLLSGVRTTGGYSQSFVLRVDNDGNTVWSRLTPSAWYNALSVQYVVDSLVYLNGVVSELGCWRTMNIHTGEIVQSQEYRADTTHRLFFQDRTPDGGHLMAGDVTHEIPGLNRLYGWVQKVDAGGQPVWSKTYRAGNINFIHGQTLLPDGGSAFLLDYYPEVNSGTTNSMLVRLDAAGQVLWTRNFGTNFSVWLSRLILTADGGLLAVGHVEDNGQGYNILLLKMDTLGQVAGCCTANRTLTVEDAPVTLLKETILSDTFVHLTPVTHPGGDLNLSLRDFCSNTPPAVTRTLKLAPGQTATLGGTAYTAPDTVSVVLPSTNGGCDTLATYLLALDCDSTFVKRFTAPGQTSTGHKIVPAPNKTFYTATAVGDKTLIALVDQNMDPIWMRTFDLADGPEALLDLRLDAGGQLIGVGNTNTAPINCFAFKLDVNTRLIQWRSGLNSPINSYFTRILEKNSDGSGHYFLLGQTDAAAGSGTGCDALLMEIDRDNGTLIWDRHYTLGSCEIFNDVFIENNLVYVCGRYNLEGGGQAGFRPALSRLDMDGNVEWSRHYLRLKGVSARLYASQMVAEPDGIVLVGYGTKSGTDLTNNSTVQLLKTDRDGQLLWAWDYDIEVTREQVGFKIVNLPDGYLLGGTFMRTTSTAGREIFLIKTDKSGVIQWQHAYGFVGEDRLRDLLVHGGNIFLIGSAQSGAGSDMVIAKLKLDGTVNPAEPCPYVKPLGAQQQAFNPLFGVAHTLMPLNVTHNYTIVPQPAPASGTLLAEVFCSKACDSDPCIDHPNPGVSLADRTLCAGQSETIAVPGFAAYSWSPAAGLGCTDCAVVTLSPSANTTYTLVLTDSTGCTATDTFLVSVLPLNMRQELVEFCPGETVVIGGTAYNQPGTAVDTLPALAGGCDTVVTYTLMDKTANQPNTLQLGCPGNLVYTVAAGANALPVSYVLPTATSACPCPDINVERSSGLASGADFPLGINTVCFRAEDACGNTKTCCFTVRVEENEGCDVKTSGCLRFELVSIKQDAAKNWVYRVRITNNCTDGLAYAFVQVPDGVQALAPAQGSVYTGASGAYTVRNPNFSPFYSLRFQPNGAGISNGQSDVFRYVLPAQTDVNYIHAAVRLASGAYIETHLNTFYCPVGVEPATLPKAAERTAPTAFTALEAYPNPAFAGAVLRISGHELPDGMFYLQDMGGRTVLERQVAGNQVYLGPDGLSTGIYYFRIIENGQFVGSGKLVVEGRWR